MPSITLTGTIKGDQGSGTLSLDPNSCVLNSFGDTGTCTQLLSLGKT